MSKRFNGGAMSVLEAANYVGFTVGAMSWYRRVVLQHSSKGMVRCLFRESLNDLRIRIGPYLPHPVCGTKLNLRDLKKAWQQREQKRLERIAKEQG